MYVLCYLSEVKEMLDVRERQLDTILKRALHKAKEKNKPQLVSITRQIDKIDPVLFFNRAKVMNKDRFFWTSTDDAFYLVGVGNVYDIIANYDRFSVTEEEWQQITQDASIHNPYHTPGTGMIAIGGMSFDPKRPRTNLWKNFPDSHLTIPEFTLTIDKDCYFLTMNTFVNVEDDIYAKVNQLLEMEETLLYQKHSLDENTHVIHKEELAVDEWLNSVHQAIEMIKHRRVNKVVLARELRLTFNNAVSIGQVIEKLLATQPNSYVFAIEREGDCFIGATPERLVKIEGNHLLSTCLAGTAPRGQTMEEDENIRQSLLQDEKNLEEHKYVVQMIRENIEQCCTNIHIPKTPTVHPLKNLQHLYTPVRATLRDDCTIFDIIKRLHPTPALGGEPRDEALAFIRQYESLDRGWYGAPVGWLDDQHNGEFVVGIRSSLIQQDEASLFAGCGIMKDSDPAVEYEETSIKFLPMLNVLEDHDDTY